MQDDRISVDAAPLRMKAVESIRTAITSFEYRPGERLVERELCDRYGVSRTVIRESLRHLEAEGLVEIVANRGPIVSSPTVAEARGLYEVREALEALATRLSAERASDLEIASLTNALALIEQAHQAGDRIAQLLAIDAFYEELCRGARNPFLASALLGINARVRVLRAMTLSSPGRAEAGLEELRQIVGAIAAHDGSRAARLAAEHVRGAASTAFELTSSGARGDASAPEDALAKADGIELPAAFRMIGVLGS